MTETDDIRPTRRVGKNPGDFRDGLPDPNFPLKPLHSSDYLSQAAEPLQSVGTDTVLRFTQATSPAQSKSDPINPLAEQRHGKAFAITGGDCLLLMA